MDAYLSGVLVGMVTALIVFGLIWWKTKGGTKMKKSKFDERQTAGRGMAFRAGFYAELIAQGLVIILQASKVLPGPAALWQFGALLVGVGVFAVTAIRFDAYRSMNESPRSFIVMGICFIAAMGISAAVNLFIDADGNRMVGLSNVMIGALWIIVVAALLIHTKRNAEDEDE